MKGEDEILEQSLSILARDHGGTGQSNGLAVFNRLLSKSVLGRTPAQDELFLYARSQIRSARIQWTTEQLVKLKGEQIASHDRESPRTDFGTESPVIVAQHKGVLRLLDGSNRINKWVSSGNTGLHDCNIHYVLES